ncbi:MAG: hypothetical protein JSW11_14035 [Candidatus Heimdallarchaeota archaeon]|nr:MAG: hypothetical protein JSW11_14035 [Candidatus Heimdallarchaeota archaeon]
MAVEYGMSLIDELKGVLERRRNVLEIFGTYKVMYDELLQNLASSYHTDIDTAVSAFYLANYVMDKLKRDKEARDKVDEDDRVKVVLENLIEAKKHLTMDFESLVHVYSLLYDWAVKIEKDLVTHARLIVNPKVIMTNLVDIYAVSFFSFLKEVVPNLDLRWAMAELAGALNKGFASEFFEDIKSNFSIEKMDPLVFFDAGFFVICPFVENYFTRKFDDVKELESFGDIGRRSYEFATSVFYDTTSRELFSPITYDEQIVSKEILELLEEELKNSLYLNHTSSRPDNPYQLLFAKFHVQIRIPNQRPEERFFYIHNFEERQSDNGHSNTLGNWNYLMLSEQNVNLQSIISYSKQRCLDIRGILSRLNVQGDIDVEHMKILSSAWMEMYIHNLQEEYNFLELKDELREQGFIPVCLLKQDKQQTIIEMLLDSPKSITSKRMDTLGIKSSMISKDQTERLLDHIKIIIDHCSNVFRLILLQNDQNLEISLHPVEFLYELQNYPGKNLSILFSSDESKLVGLLCQNEASLEYQAKSLKHRQVFSKINQLLTDLRIKSMADARAAKLENYITRATVESLYEPGSLWLSGDISKSFGVSSTDESVTDRIDLVIKKEKERIEAMKVAEREHQEALKRERQVRLHAERVLYFNEIVLKRVFNEVNLKIQNSILNLLKDQFPEIFGLEQEHRSIKMRLKDLNDDQEKTTEMSDHMKEILDSLAQKIIDGNVKNISEILPELEKIWVKISEMSKDEILAI